MRIAILGTMVESCDTAAFGLFNRMSPTALLSSALLHAAVAAAFVASARPAVRPSATSADAIELTVELPSASPARPAPMPAIAIALPAMPDDTAVPDPPPSARPRPRPKRVLPPLEAPPPPLSAREVAVLVPPPASPPPVQRPTPSDARGVRPASRPALDAEGGGLRRAREDYLRHLVRKLSHSRFAQDSAEAARGLVVARLTLACDGRLVGESLVKSSGSPELDNGVMKAIRQAAPFAPLPADLAQDHYTFVVPINYVRDR